MEIIVDNAVVPKEDTFVAETLILNSTPIGSYGGEMWACFDSQLFPAGVHTATLQTMTTLGEEHSYTWKFRN